MTLPEVLISVVLTGLLIASLAMSITVLYRQSDNTTGRVNNARSEQNVNVWMPTDLASAESVDTLPGSSPCSPSCPPGADVGGTNALMLTWTGTVPGAGGVAVPTVTKVSYRYVLVGAEYQMIRVECVSVDSAAPTCQRNVVLHDLDPPPIGINYVEGQTPPTWIMVVSQALDPADTTGSTPISSDDPTFKNKNGQRVVVTINGGGDVAGAGGGENQISLSAGGTDRSTELATNSVSFNQSLTAARTRCGGNFGMIIDTSGSIGSTNMSTVRTALTSMIDTFAGTPVKLEFSQFSTVAQILGGAANGSRYFDMLKESDVDDLKKYVNGGTTSTGATPTALVSNGSTNYEDALYRMFRNSDGTIQANLPSKVIFFTDGIPSASRLGYVSGGTTVSGTTALPAPTAYPDDTGLAASNGSTFSQVGWNRANRVAREFGVQVDFIGLYLGSDTTASSNWTDVHAGYHLQDWKRGYHDVWERAYHDGYQRGNTVVYQKGYHFDYQRGNNVSWQKGYHLDYQYATNGLVFEQFKNGSWTSESASNYFSKNTNNTSTDNHRARVSGTLSGWTTMPLSDYNLSNTTSDALDGFQVVNSYTSPFNLWETATQSAYNTGNSAAGPTDGWQTITTGGATSWTPITSADYTLNNTTSDATDGFQTVNNYTAPFSLWENTTQAVYDPVNTTADGSDGWRTTTTGTPSSWTNVTQAQYNASNTTTDATDGWQIIKVYSSPFVTWEATTQAIYNSGNSTSDESDGYRTYRSYTSPFSSWESTDEATYIANKTPGLDPTNTTDGWTATKIYIPPYTAYDATHTYSRTNYDILGQLIDPSGLVAPITDVNGTVINAEVANMYTSTDWSKMQGALRAIALGQCGGTLTLQTRIGSTTPANDTFTYTNNIDNTKVETSGSKRSGTFDFAIPSGGSVVVDINQAQTSVTNDHYSPVGWTCKAGGVPVTPTIVDVPNSPWDTIRLTIAANQAVSCIQNVTFTP